MDEGSNPSRILIVGIDPALVDYTAPGLPPGLSEAAVRAELDRMPAAFAAAGLDARHCLLRPGEDAEPPLDEAIAAAHPHCILVGGGIRMTMPETLEQVVATVRRAAPTAVLCFPRSPADALAAAQRGLAAIERG